VAGLFVAVVIAAAVLAVGVAFYDLTVTAAGLLIGLLVLVVGALTMTACGFALAAPLPNARAVGAVGLTVLLPLAFFSDVFVVGGPEWMTTVGSFFPLLHVQRALTAAWDPGGAEVAWASLGVLVVWLVVASAIAVRLFRWEPPTGS
jgi:hypothetical protein